MGIIPRRLRRKDNIPGYPAACGGDIHLVFYITRPICNLLFK